jgi:hypothetical protein
MIKYRVGKYMQNILLKKRFVLGILILFIGTSFVSADINIIGGKSISDGEHLKNYKNNKQFIDFTETTSFGEFDAHCMFSNGTYSCYRVLNLNKNHPKITGDDNYYVYEQTNNSIFIIKVVSPSNFSLENFRCDFHWNITTTTPTSTGRAMQCFLTNNTWMVPLLGIHGTGIETAGKFRYFHVGLGRFTYTYDNRTLHNASGYHWTDFIQYPLTLPLPPGTWYFVFAGGFWDLNDREVLDGLSIRMNLSGTDLGITTSEGGTVYALDFCEYDNNLLLSKAGFLEMMLRGKAHFSVHNIFLYYLPFGPDYKGFWRIKWITPDGTKKVNILISDQEYYCDPDSFQECTKGVGRSGEYELRTSYLDYVHDSNIPWALPPYFFGVDIELP